MRLLEFITIGLLVITSKVSCESYSRQCFMNYMFNHNLLGDAFKVFNKGEKVDSTCETSVNGVIDKMRSSVNDSCIAEFWKKKFVSETILKEYLIPQFRVPQSEVHFDDRFTAFRNKAYNISRVICTNKEVFRPDLRSLMRQGRSQKDSKSRELECLQIYIKRNKPLDEECTKIVDMVKEEFYKSTDNDMKRVFAAPNDSLVNTKCLDDKAKNTQLFEKIFFFVILATMRDMNDQQIDALLSRAEGVITSSTKMIFECMT